MHILGIDIGGSGIKAAVVDTDNGELVTDRHKIETPQPSRPEAVAAVVTELCRDFQWEGPLGCTFPAVVQRGIVRSAANVDSSWIGTDGASLFTAATGRAVTLLNDADAAGLAEVTFGAAAGRAGVVILLTFGTGIGSAVFVDGMLFPNTELGHLEFKGGKAEHYAASRVRKAEGLTYAEWGARVNELLLHIERLFSPDLFVVGGGVSRKFDRFAAQFDGDVDVVPATLRNEAGIVGAALACAGRLAGS